MTILFADIAGFTAYSSSVPASKGSILSYLFIDNQLRLLSTGGAFSSLKKKLQNIAMPQFTA